jgi:VWFA-related protein
MLKSSRCGVSATWMLILVTGSAMCLAGPAPAKVPSQETVSQQPVERNAIKAVSEEVLLDLVVRDKKGRPVRDLKPQEVQVFEDGVRQEVTSFRLVEEESATTTSGAEAEPEALPPQPAPLRHINLVTLVFERLGNESRQLARQAALDFLGTELSPNVLVSVFGIDQRLFVLQHFTNDRSLLRKAVESGTNGNYSQFVSESEAIRRELETVATQQTAGEAAAGAIGRDSAPSPGMGTTFADARLAEMTLNILQFSESLQREQQGRSSVFALLSLVKEQRRLAGRKTLIYFSEGLHVTPSLADIYRTTISEANRSNVSVYAVDARGLLTTAMTEGTRSTLREAADASRRQILTGAARPVTREEAMIGETAEASLRANTQATLGDLSISTGGLLIANSNDLRMGMRQVNEDIRGYYELAYRPPSREYDAKFHRVAVKILRPGVAVQTRSGYFALPPVAGGSVLPYEIPMLAALNAGPLPRAFDFHAAVLQFARTPQGVEQVVVLEVPLSNFTFMADKKKGVYRATFSLMALLKDANGRLVEKFSQNYPVEGPLDKLEALKKGSIVFTRNLRLPPGRYTLESVARDQETNKTSALRSVSVVPQATPGVDLSSVTVIRRLDPAGANDQDRNDPFRYQQHRIVPNLGEPLRRGSPVSLFLVVYPASLSAGTPQLALQILRDGEVVGQAIADLPKPDAAGRIPYIATLSTEKLPPGQYEIRAVASQGSSNSERHAFFTASP